LYRVYRGVYRGYIFNNQDIWWFFERNAKWFGGVLESIDNKSIPPWAMFLVPGLVLAYILVTGLSSGQSHVEGVKRTMRQ